MNLIYSLIGTRAATVLRGELPAALEGDEGQTLVEYALILVFISIAVIAALTFLAGDISSFFTTVGNAL
jgi:Flp pilus assembly pilin Flp